MEIKIDPVWSRRKKMKSEVTVVMYHYVRDLKNSRYPNIKGLDIDKFKKQIKFFKENYNFIKSSKSFK